MRLPRLVDYEGSWHVRLLSAASRDDEYRQRQLLIMKSASMPLHAVIICVNSQYRDGDLSAILFISGNADEAACLLA